jgi:hypothetical protein
VVLVQCTAAAALEIPKLKGPEALAGGAVGDSPHEIAIVSFGAGPTLLRDFTNDSAKLTSAVSEIRLCGEGVCVLGMLDEEQRIIRRQAWFCRKGVRGNRRGSKRLSKR